METLAPPSIDAIEILGDGQWHEAILTPERDGLSANDYSPIVFFVRPKPGDPLSEDFDPIMPFESTRMIEVRRDPSSGFDLSFTGTARVDGKEIRVDFLGTEAGFFLHEKQEKPRHL